MPIYMMRGTPTPPAQERPDIDTYSWTASMDVSDCFGLGEMHALCCSDDGHYIYIGNSSNMLANYYLSDSSYSSFTGNYSSRTSINANGSRGLYYKNSTNVYSVTDGSSYHGIYQIIMQSANDLTNSSESTLTENITNGLTSGIEFSPDGTRLYLGVYTTTSVMQYDLSIPRDVSSVVTSQSFSFPESASIYCLRFSPTGLKMYLSGRHNASSSNIRQYNLGTAYDLSTSVYTGKTLTGYDIFDFTDDGRLFCGRAYNRDNTLIAQYDSNS